MGCRPYIRGRSRACDIVGLPKIDTLRRHPSKGNVPGNYREKYIKNRHFTLRKNERSFPKRTSLYHSCNRSTHAPTSLFTALPTLPCLWLQIKLQSSSTQSSVSWHLVRQECFEKKPERPNLVSRHSFSSDTSSSIRSSFLRSFNFGSLSPKTYLSSILILRGSCIKAATNNVYN